MWPSHDKLAAAARGCGVQHPFPLLFTGPKDLGRSGLINWYEGRNRTASGRVTRRARIANRCAGALILFLFDVDVLEFWCWVVMLFRSWFAIRAPKARTGRERSQTQKSRRTSLGERWAVNEAPARAHTSPCACYVVIMLWSYFATFGNQLLRRLCVPRRPQYAVRLSTWESQIGVPVEEAQILTRCVFHQVAAAAVATAAAKMRRFRPQV